MATEASQTQIFLLTQLNWRTPQTPIWCKNIDDISYTNQVMVDLCPNDVSLLPWQQGWV